MNKKTCLKLSLTTFIISIVSYALSYFMFHYLTDDGLTNIKQEEAGKPFVTDCVGNFATLMMAAAVIFLLLAIFVYNKKQEN